MKRLGWVPYIGHELGLVSIRMLGRYPVRVQGFWVPAVEAAERALIVTGYEHPCDWIGSYALRNVADTPYWSWHATGGAFDLDYGGNVPGSTVSPPAIDKNPHLHRPIRRGDRAFGRECQILEHQVDAVEAIRTVSGATVWRWLGWSIGDTMHFEPACTPADIASGIIEEGEEDMYEQWAVDLFRSFSAAQLVEMKRQGRYAGDPEYWIRMLAGELTKFDRIEIAHFVATIIANIPHKEES